MTDKLNDSQVLEWLSVRKELIGEDSESLFHKETFTEKFLRKFNENPLVPLGSVATLGALSYGLWCFRAGQSHKSQLMMRFRILAQGFTVVALVAGIGYTAMKPSKSFFQDRD